jgi:hypothetical protein
VASSFAASETTGFFLLVRILKEKMCSKKRHIHNDLQQNIPKVVSSLLATQNRSAMRNVFLWVTCAYQLKKTISGSFFNILKPTGYVMHQQV